MITKKSFYKIVSNEKKYTKEEISKILNNRIDEFYDTLFDIQYSDVYDTSEKEYFTFYYNTLIRELEYLDREVFKC